MKHKFLYFYSKICFVYRTFSSTCTIVSYRTRSLTCHFVSFRTLSSRFLSNIFVSSYTFFFVSQSFVRLEPFQVLKGACFFAQAFTAFSFRAVSKLAHLPSLSAGISFADIRQSKQREKSICVHHKLESWSRYCLNSLRICSLIRASENEQS